MRERVLGLASDLLIEQGLSVGLEAVGMERVISAAGVSRASAYRRWPSRADFLADVLVHTLRRTALIPESSEDIRRLVDILETRRAGLVTEQGRRDIVVEALRVSLDTDVRRTLASDKWRLFMALSATHQGLPDVGLRETVVTELASMEHAMVERRADVYTMMAEMIGYRQRAPWSGREGFLMLSALAGLTMRGVLSRALGDPGWLDERDELVLFGTSAPAPWSQAEIALATILLGHLEPDPLIEWTPQRITAAEQQFSQVAASLSGPVTLHPHSRRDVQD